MNGRGSRSHGIASAAGACYCERGQCVCFPSVARHTSPTEDPSESADSGDDGNVSPKSLSGSYLSARNARSTSYDGFRFRIL